MGCREKREEREKEGKKGREETFVGGEELHHFVIRSNFNRVLEVTHNVVPLQKGKRRRGEGR